ncbi:hypothetical protein [Microbacterium sp.]|uniref:hypothetical protein n=1 Tax=Microbacterium sp. TaxID=51671 RepID=UPI0039E51657
MAARGSKSAQQARAQAERARLHEARKAWHDRQISRRVRDNTIVGIAGAVIVIAAFASQVVHAQVTAPVPSPTPTSTVTPDVAPTPSPTDAVTPVPSDEATTPPAG